MAFKNRVRLPFQLYRPQFQEERSVFRKSTGELKTLSVIVRKVFQAETDLLPATVHEKLKIALAHDTVNVEGDRFLGEVVQEGDYSISWPDFLDYPIGKGTFQAEVKAFNATNSNCATCDDLLGLEVNDIRYESAYGVLIPLAEGGTYTIDVTQSSTVCCSPATYSIASYNTTYVQSISISSVGVVTFTIKNGVASVSQLPLFTYRVACPNEVYDDGVVTVAVTGTAVASCSPPSNITATTITPTVYDYVWTAPVGGRPVGGYDWRLFHDGGLTPIESGTVMLETVHLTELIPTDYYVLSVRSNCGGGVYSDWYDVAFNPPPATQSCGLYDVNWTDYSQIPYRFQMVSYVACDGSQQQVAVYNDVGKAICALQNGPNDPVSIVGATSLYYIGLC